MDMFLPGRGAIDLEKGTVGFYGDGNQPVEITTVDDTAAMTARVALDRDGSRRQVRFRRGPYLLP